MNLKVGQHVTIIHTGGVYRKYKDMFKRMDTKAPWDEDNLPAKNEVYVIEDVKPHTIHDTPVAYCVSIKTGKGYLMSVNERYLKVKCGRRQGSIKAPKSDYRHHSGNPSGCSFPLTVKLQAVALRKSGMKVKGIAKQCNASSATIYNWLRQHKQGQFNEPVAFNRKGPMIRS